MNKNEQQNSALSNDGDIFDDLDNMSEEYSDKAEEQDIAEDFLSRYDGNIGFFEKIYNLIADFGMSVCKYFALIILKTFNFIRIPSVKIFKLFKIIILTIFNLLKYAKRRIDDEAHDFKNDVKNARAKLKSNRKADESEKESTFLLLVKYIKTAFSRHSLFLKHASNYILPLVMLVVLFSVVRYWSGLDFALEVKYNDVNIGYIESEKVFRQAREILDERLEIGNQEADADPISEPKYKIAVVKLNELSDSNMICEQIIENSDSGLINACGVYVDDKFIASVTNESDASLVFKSLVKDYCKENGIDENDSDVLVDVSENITYIQGLYSEKTLMTSEKLKEYVKSKTKSETGSYTVGKGDNPYSIAKRYGMTDEQFYALNPDLESDESIKVGTTVNVIRSIPYINISVSETKITTREIKYGTTEIKTDALYQGVKRVLSKGKNGEETVTNLVTYINGTEVSSKVISSTVTKEPVDEKVYVGTKPIPSYVTIYGISSGTFIWPVAGANYVTSGFGYRFLFGKTSFHRGIDISGSGALGKPVIASAAGTVEKVTSGNTGYGYSVLIDHGNGIKTRYGHCLAGSITVNVGDSVAQGQMIAQLGSTGNSTGPHLHFEIIYNGAYTNPLDYVSR